MTLAIALDVLVVAWLLWRQLKVRRVWPRLTFRLAAVLCVLGLVELVDYTGHHHVSAAVAGILTLSFGVGAVALGALRAATVRIWRAGPVVLRQGTWLTVGLWVLSLGLHYGAEGWIDSLHGAGGVISASLLLWLGVAYGVQNAVVHHRAEGLLGSVGPVIDARSEAVGGRRRAGRWAGWDDAGTGGRTGGAPPHPDAIEARADPVDARSEAVAPEGPGGPAGGGPSAGTPS